jgi:hypothetical protein
MRIVLLLMLVPLMVPIFGCSFSLFGERDLPELPAAPDADHPAPARVEGAIGPFPWGWTLGILLVGAVLTGAMILKAPTLVDEVIVGTAGALGLILLIEMAREVWHAKWILAGCVGGVMLCLGLWKGGRWAWRRWFSRSSADSASPSTSEGSTVPPTA